MVNNPTTKKGVSWRTITKTVDNPLDVAVRWQIVTQIFRHEDLRIPYIAVFIEEILYKHGNEWTLNNKTSTVGMGVALLENGVLAALSDLKRSLEFQLKLREMGLSTENTAGTYKSALKYLSFLKI